MIVAMVFSLLHWVIPYVVLSQPMGLDLVDSQAFSLVFSRLMP